MITNKRQYRITKRELSKLRSAIAGFDQKAVADQVGSGALAQAELNALKSEEESLESQVKEYEALQSGAITKLKASDLSELPNMLIRARIAKGLSQRELADLIGVKEQQIQRYESEQYASANLRRLREVAEALNLSITEIAEFKPTLPAKQILRSEDLDWRKFPVKEMYRRQWFEDFSGSLSAALEEAETIVQSFVKSVINKPMAALHRKHVRSSSLLDDYALLAWECRILSLAKKKMLGATYGDRSVDDKWIDELAKQSQYEDGPRLAKEHLESAGIALIVEPHLPNTHLDGAALLHDNIPVIGMTLRYDRLDNFWFVLFHELFHVVKHLRKNRLESIFDDLETTETDKIEHEADSLACEALIPEKIWNTALARYVRSEQSVVKLAAELKISPAIVAGRIRYEAKNYVILNNLVGQGKARKYFPDADFGK